MDNETVLSFPISDIPCNVNPDTSNYQLGGVLLQEGKLVVSFYRKLIENKKIYNNTDKEVLSIMETLK